LSAFDGIELNISVGYNMDKRIKNEIAHGEYLAREGAGDIWNWETPAGKLRWRRRVFMLTNGIGKQDKVLEIGCGTGYFTRHIAETGADVMAIDISPELIKIAQNELKKIKNITFKIENAYEMTFDDNNFDYVIGSSVLHHLDINKALKEIYRVLKPGGKIVFTEPNMLNPQIAIQKNVKYIKKRLGDSPDESAFFKWDIENKLKNNGFINTKAKPFDFLHPLVPNLFVSIIAFVGGTLEIIPFVKEIAGSLYIKGEK